jgi:hypothetical protein
MRENCTSGSVEGAAGDRCPYSDPWIRDRRAERGSCATHSASCHNERAGCGVPAAHACAVGCLSRSDMPQLVVAKSRGKWPHAIFTRSRASPSTISSPDCSRTPRVPTGTLTVFPFRTIVVP